MKIPFHQLFSNGPGVRLTLVAVAIVLIGCSCSRPVARNDTPLTAEPSPAAAPVATPAMPPPTAYADLGWIGDNNRRSRLSDFRGKVLVLDFYATWCKPCRESIPRLTELQNKYGAAGLQIVGLNVGGPDDRVKVSAFVKELGIKYPLGFPDKSLTDLFFADDDSIPRTFVFGRDGQMKEEFVGYSEEIGTNLETVIQTQLAAPPPAKGQG